MNIDAVGFDCWTKSWMHVLRIKCCILVFLYFDSATYIQLWIYGYSVNNAFWLPIKLDRWPENTIWYFYKLNCMDKTKFGKFWFLIIQVIFFKEFYIRLAHVAIHGFIDNKLFKVMWFKQVWFLSGKSLSNFILFYYFDVKRSFDFLGNRIQKHYILMSYSF